MLAFAYTAPISALIHLTDRQPEKTEEPDWRAADRTAYDEWELRLRKTLGTKVTIRRTEPDKGQIVIDYYSVEDLERITDRLK